LESALDETVYLHCRDALRLDGNDLGDARDALLEDALDPLLQRDRRDGASLTSAEEANRHGVPTDPFEPDVATIHLDGRTDQFEGLFDPVFDGHGLVHPLILAGEVARAEASALGFLF
jgi:hypothetical protein